MKTIAILYCDPRGPYHGMPDVDCWDEARDARLYAGPHPVVAHPPCARWGQLSHLAKQDTADCGPRAVTQVQAWGGVLEHPAYSRLWDYCALPKPGASTDAYGGRTYEVCQVDWGHVARKRTWLYVVRVDQAWVMRRLRERSGRGVATHCVSRDCRRKSSVLKRASSQMASRTPPAFAELLVSMARRST